MARGAFFLVNLQQNHCAVIRVILIPPSLTIMKKYSLFIIAIIGLSAFNAMAQTPLSGVVTTADKNTKLENVLVRDIAAKQVGLTDKDGSFTIRTGVGHTLIFTLIGYVPDTLFLIDLQPKTIQLRAGGTNLREVTISSSKAGFDPQTEYPQVYEKSKFALSFSRMFGKESRDARRLKKYFENEAEQRKIDSVFTPKLVTSIVPLKGPELEQFMSLYRPTLSFTQNATKETWTVYINDSYRSFEALPPDKRVPPKLN